MIPIYAKIKDKYYPVSISEAEVPEPKIYYCLGKEGLFIIDNNTAHSIKKLSEINQFDSIKEEIIHYYPTVKFEIFQTALTFFREVYKKHKSEAVILLTLNRNQPLQDQSYKIRIPKQKAGPGSISYDVMKDEEFKNSLEEGEFLAGSIHSHPSFSAGQSGTDHTDEISFDGVHITLGNIDTTVSVHERICLRGECYSPKDESLIETVPKAQNIEIPEDWINKVSSYTPTHNNIVGHCRYIDDDYGAWGAIGFESSTFPSKTVKDIFRENKPVQLNQKNSKHLINVISEPAHELMLKFLGDTV